MESYQKWLVDPTPDNMSGILKELDPTLTAEASRYGQGPLFKTKAKTLAVKAIQTYKPESGAKLRSWVVTNLQPLSRYRQSMVPVRMPEAATARAAELNRMHQEYADEHGSEPSDEQLSDISGIHIKRVQNLRNRSRATVSESALTANVDADAMSGGLPAVNATKSNMAEAGEEIYKGLDPRSKAIYDLSTGLHGKNQLAKTEIAKRLGVSPAFISQQSDLIAKQIHEASQLYGN